MMISPEAYADDMKNSTYEALLAERDRLLCSVREFERASRRMSDLQMTKPSQDTVYQMELEYLAELCRLIPRAYRTGR